MAQHQRPVGEGQLRGIVLVDDLQRGLGRRQRVGNRLDEPRRRRALARDDPRQQLVPALLAAAIDAIARAHVAIDVGRGGVALGGARDGDGARGIPEAQGIERRALELRHGELIDVLQIVGLRRHRFAIVAPRLVVVLGLQRRIAQRPVEHAAQLLLGAREDVVGERGGLAPLGERRQAALRRLDHRRHRRLVALDGARPRAVDAVGERAHIVGIGLQQFGGDDLGLGRLVGGVPGGHRLLVGIGAQHARGIPGVEDLHRRRPLFRVARIERRHVGVVLGGIGKAAASSGRRDRTPRRRTPTTARERTNAPLPLQLLSHPRSEIS